MEDMRMRKSGVVEGPLVMDREVCDVLSLPEIGYSRVWEDHRVLSRALYVQPHDTVLCITSSGDNVLNLLLDEPRRIVAIDMSWAQNALLELKLAAIRCLCHQDFLVLLGETEDTQQMWDEIYTTVVQDGEMPAYALQYWAVHHKAMKTSGSWFGKFEKFMLKLPSELLVGVVSNQEVDHFLSACSLEEQREIFDSWPLDKFRDAYRNMASQKSQQRSRGAAKLKYVEMSDTEIQDVSWARLERVCREVPVRDNFYLSWLLRGGRGYDPLIKPDYSSPYLTKEGFEKLKGLVDRVVVHTGAIEDYFASPGSEKPSKVALSNIFEYMSQESAESVFEILGSHVPSGGRIAYWEYLNTRLPSTSGEVRLQEMTEQSQKLRKEDRSLYFLFRILQVQ